MTGETPVDAFKLRRIVAAYKLGLATRAKRPGTWGHTQPISEDAEKQYLSEEDSYRTAPFPYPGLRSFDPNEGELYFGRERNVEALQAILAERRLVIVLGGSGSGKSSLIRAGLLPHLNTDRRIPGRDGNWYSVEFRPRTDPLGQLSAAIVDQLLCPLLKLRCDGLPEAMGLPSNVDVEDIASTLRDQMRQRFLDARKKGRDQVRDTLLEIADKELDLYDKLAMQGRRLAEPNLFLLIDQLEEVFRPEIAPDERETLLNLIIDIHSYMKGPSRRGGLFLAATMRSEEVYRCAEQRGLSDVVIGSGYQIELLDPRNEEDARDLRRAIVKPARNVFEDWGLDAQLDHPDAPFAQGVPNKLLNAAARLSQEIDHQPDQLPLLQHALQAMWHAAMRRWSDTNSGRLQILGEDLPRTGSTEMDLNLTEMNLSDCLNARADKAADRAAERFAKIAQTDQPVGMDALKAAFRALARRDDKGYWARRFANRSEITAFLEADVGSAVASVPDEERWNALQEALQEFQMRGYLSGGDGRDYDISHEALIRNWKKFQDWLRGPEEVAYALSRVLQEVDPAQFTKAPESEKILLIPRDLADKAYDVAEGGKLPARWGEDQIAPYLLRSALRKRWGADKQNALRNLTKLAAVARGAQKRIDEKEKDAAVAEEASKQRRRVGLGLLALVVVVAIGAFLAWQKTLNDALRASTANGLIATSQKELLPGVAERIAIHVRDLMEGRGQPIPPQTLSELTFAKWDTSARSILGDRLRVGSIDNRPVPDRRSIDNTPVADQRLTCLANINTDAKAGKTSNSIALGDPNKSEIRLTLSAGSTTAVGVEIKSGQAGWHDVPQDNPIEARPGARYCLGSEGSILTESYEGLKWPRLYELLWRSCPNRSSCDGASWRIFSRQIRTLSETDNVDSASFPCVLSIRPISPAATGSLPRVEIDFTVGTQSPSCAPAQAQAPIGTHRETYLPGIRAAMVRRAGPTKKLDYKTCNLLEDSEQLKCDITANGGQNQSLFLRRIISQSPDRWSIWAEPVNARIGVSGGAFLVSSGIITSVAVDDRDNIWFKDRDGNFWELINDQTALKTALWQLASGLVTDPEWWQKAPPELPMSMTEKEKAKTE